MTLPCDRALMEKAVNLLVDCKETTYSEALYARCREVITQLRAALAAHHLAQKIELKKDHK